MKIFLDTSSVFKLYQREEGTAELVRFVETKVSKIYLSEITKIEFASTVMKKVRMKEFTEIKARETLEWFELDSVKYSFVDNDKFIFSQARKLISKYGTQGLRTLDGIQLATAVSLTHTADVFYTNDVLMKTFFELEGLPTK